MKASPQPVASTVRTGKAVTRPPAERVANRLPCGPRVATASAGPRPARTRQASSGSAARSSIPSSCSFTLTMSASGRAASIAASAPRSLSHRVGRKFTSKDTRAPAARPIRAASRVAVRQGSAVRLTDPKWKKAARSSSSRSSSSDLSIMSAPGWR